MRSAGIGDKSVSPSGNKTERPTNTAGLERQEDKKVEDQVQYVIEMKHSDERKKNGSSCLACAQDTGAGTEFGSHSRGCFDAPQRIILASQMCK